MRKILEEARDSITVDQYNELLEDILYDRLFGENDLRLILRSYRRNK